MDKSGEGHIDQEEIFDGYNNIVGKIDGEDKITMDEAEEIIKQVDLENDKKLDYEDFIIAAIDLSDDNMRKYCKRAEELFFK